MRRLFVVPVGLFVVTVVFFVLGFAVQLPFFLVTALICATPCFLIAAGFAFGKASNQYRFIVPKDQAVIQQQRSRRLTTNYDANTASGELRGN